MYNLFMDDIVDDLINLHLIENSVLIDNEMKYIDISSIKYAEIIDKYILERTTLKNKFSYHIKIDTNGNSCKFNLYLKDINTEDFIVNSFKAINDKMIRVYLDAKKYIDIISILDKLKKSSLSASNNESEIEWICKIIIPVLNDINKESYCTDIILENKYFKILNTIAYEFNILFKDFKFIEDGDDIGDFSIRPICYNNRKFGFLISFLVNNTAISYTVTHKV